MDLRTSLDQVLPDEIMAWVFQLGQAMPCIRGSKPFAITCSHVSRRWRTVSLGHPAVWSVIKCSRIGMLELMLERSKESIIELVLDVAMTSQPRRQLLERTIELISHHIHRTRSLILLESGNSFDMGHMVVHLSQLNAPVLQRLELIAPRNQYGLFRPPFSSGMPFLTSLKVRNVILQRTSGLLSALTDLGIDVVYGVAYKDFKDWLSSSSSLQRLSFSGQIVGIPQPCPQFTLSNLQCLDLTIPGRTSEEVSRPFMLLDVPVLKSLEIRFFTEHGWSWFMSNAGSKPILKYPSVEMLTLAHLGIMEPAPSNFFTAFPAVRQLRLQAVPGVDALSFLFPILSASNSHSQTPVWPALCSIIIESHYIDEKVLLSFVHARNLQGAPISSLSTTHGALTDETRKTLQTELAIRTISGPRDVDTYW
jgi:hypothetical protein